ncbi:MAG: FGGY family carbohydrate kinase [Desulfobacterales bacterium]|jgi:xylulokinase
MGYLLGIDLGSTSIKAVAYDFAGNIAASHSVPAETKNLDPDHPTWSFWDPDTVWNTTIMVIKHVVAQIGNAADIKGIAVTGLGMDGVPLDKNGEWLYPFISWQCTRTEPQSRSFSQKYGAENIFDLTGKQVLHIDTIYRLLWMKENRPEILDKTDKWLLIEDFINFMLCGRQATDYTMASCTSLFEQKALKWSDELFDSAGLDKALFPQALPSGTVLGEVMKDPAEKTGLKKGTPVILGGHDYICAALAVGAFAPDVMMDVTGTWEIIVRTLPELVLNQDIFKAGINVEAHVAKDAYLLAGYSPSALMLEWFRDNYGFEEKEIENKTGKSEWDSLMEKAAGAPSGANGVFFLPHLAGAGTPDIDSRSLGAFVGLSTTTDKGCMLRAIIEGLDYQFKDILFSFERALPGSIQKIIAVGGAVRNELWMQNKADVTGKFIEVPALEEATTLGAALLAGIGLGIYKDEQDALQQTYKEGRIYQPDPKRQKEYEEYYQIFKKLYPSLKEVNHAIFNRFKS